MKKLKVELSVERYQRLTIRRTSTLTQDWCEACGEEVVMLTGEEAAKLLGKPSREVYRQAEHGLWHCGENPGGTLLICVKSLLAGGSEFRQPQYNTSRGGQASVEAGTQDCSQPQRRIEE